MIILANCGEFVWLISVNKGWPTTNLGVAQITRQHGTKGKYYGSGF
jgi:hypothetical protein